MKPSVRLEEQVSTLGNILLLRCTSSISNSPDKAAVCGTLQHTHALPQGKTEKRNENEPYQCKSLMSKLCELRRRCDSLHRRPLGQQHSRLRGRCGHNLLERCPKAPVRHLQRATLQIMAQSPARITLWPPMFCCALRRRSNTVRPPS